MALYLFFSFSNEMVMSIAINISVYRVFRSEWVTKWSALHDTLSTTFLKVAYSYSSSKIFCRNRIWSVNHAVNDATIHHSHINHSRHKAVIPLFLPYCNTMFFQKPIMIIHPSHVFVVIFDYKRIGY